MRTQVAFLAPPPQTSTSSAPAQCARIASASVRAVKRGERRLHVFRAAAPVRRAPAHDRASCALKRSRPGALRRRRGEITARSSSTASSCRIDVPDAAQRAVVVEGRVAMAQAPQVEQDVARAGVESAHAAARRQIGDVRDAADVGDDAMPIRRANSAAWNAGTSGAPCPPAAISRARKSATTVM